METSVGCLQTQLTALPFLYLFLPKNNIWEWDTLSTMKTAPNYASNCRKTGFNARALPLTRDSDKDDDHSNVRQNNNKGAVKAGNTPFQS